MINKIFLLIVALMIACAQFTIVRAAEAAKPNAPADTKAAAPRESKELESAKQLAGLDAFGKNLCKQILLKPVDAYKYMNFEFIIRISSTQENIESLGGNVKELAAKTLEETMTKSEYAPPKVEKCVILSKDIVPCEKMYAMIAQTSDVQSGWKDNNKLSDDERTARVAKAAKESGITTCGIFSEKSRVKGESEITETVTAGAVGDKWNILLILSSETSKE
jgi:hypothetical protein